jgi:hypothetical protein
MTNEEKFRLPTQTEMDDLVAFCRKRLGIDHNEQMDELKQAVSDAHIVVFPDYITSFVGFRGKVMVVVWATSPGRYEAYRWEDEQIMLIEQEAP